MEWVVSKRHASDAVRPSEVAYRYKRSAIHHDLVANKSASSIVEIFFARPNIDIGHRIAKMTAKVTEKVAQSPLTVKRCQH